MKMYAIYFSLIELQIEPLDAGGEVQEELIEAFNSDGRLTHMTRLMAYHPGYLRVRLRPGSAR